jgi:endonuclease G
MKKIFLTIIALLLLALYVSYMPATNAEAEQFSYVESEATENLSANADEESTPSIKTEALEIPVANSPLKEKVLKRMGYTVSFNMEMNIPNWVAWELNSDRLIERESRGNKFTSDPDLGSRRSVTPDEYKGSGWDRGHMCPAGDNRWHWRAMDESFYMTNICPQNHNLNRGDWKELEEACRRWAAIEPVYIVCGPILYDSPKHGCIGECHKIRIPDAFFKVILTGITSGSPRSIGFIYKNEAGNYKRDKYVNSVDEVERITGLDFFSALPDKVEMVIESQYNMAEWP